jgi:hypothetical protein
MYSMLKRLHNTNLLRRSKHLKSVIQKSTHIWQNFQTRISYNLCCRSNCCKKNTAIWNLGFQEYSHAEHPYPLFSRNKLETSSLNVTLKNKFYDGTAKLGYFVLQLLSVNTQAQLLSRAVFAESRTINIRYLRYT